MATRPSYQEVLCHLTFSLARDHTWASHRQTGQYLQKGFTQKEREVAVNDIIPDIKKGRIEHIGYQNGEMWLRGDKHDEAAEFLRDNCGYSELRIEASLSRFDGFD